MPIGMVTDLPQLVRALASPGTGRLTELPFDVTEDEPRAQGYRVLTTTLGSLAPNTIVLECSADGTARTHQLVETDAGPLP